MSENKNSELASGVGQDSSTNDVTKKYDSQHGTYKGAEPAVEPSKPNTQGPAPFKVGG